MDFSRIASALLIPQTLACERAQTVSSFELFNPSNLIDGKWSIDQPLGIDPKPGFPIRIVWFCEGIFYYDICVVTHAGFIFDVTHLAPSHGSHCAGLTAFAAGTGQSAKIDSLVLT